MQPFDHIQEPPPAKTSRIQRNRKPQTSPLDVYQVEEYQPPRIPKPPNHEGSRTCRILLMVFWTIWLVGIGVWIVIAIRFTYNLLPESPINPVRHVFNHVIFIVALLFTVLATCFGIAFVTNRWTCYAFLSYVTIAVFAVALIKIFEPYNCENTNMFPMYVKLYSGNPASAIVYINNKPYYYLNHERKNGVHHTYISGEHFGWESLRGQQAEQTIPWPYETGVTSILTSLRPSMGADGTIWGSCRDKPCLRGKFWMTPNLVFEWEYQNPITGTKRRTRLASNEGRWYFGNANRALVSLHANGTEVFRAQSSSTVCTAGDGDLETSLVPVGLMLIAENNFNAS